MSGARITFGMIVLNGEPFVRYNLRALYPWAHQIIVVEGACRAAAAVATADGRSRDGTREELRRFQREEDPDRKLVVVTAEDEGHPDGFWPGEKHEMSQAYARRARGDWLWQVDVDEFYLPKDMARIAERLSSNPGISRLDFPMRTFSASPRMEVGGYLLNGFTVRRLFAWKPSYRYSTHRPPMVVDENGRDVSSSNPSAATEQLRRGMFMYHYEQLFPKQVLEKCSYYARVDWLRSVKNVEAWARDCYFSLRRPYHVHMVYQHPSWIQRYDGPVPPEVLRMYAAVGEGRHPGVTLRPTADMEALADSRAYAAGRRMLQVLYPAWAGWRWMRNEPGRLRRRWRAAAGRRSPWNHANRT
jgi:hypothetical protein